ncbi:hypothetical protein H5410_062840 [Solanum commersonii]|uniref:Uncharacterized protein n=1 Tax=Solanum commersonii TaxID=4109 RepID=A0A9J5WBW3_SOLCO|nr:hypothetical protein H5410_062840 [Solanum commersonii]
MYLSRQHAQARPSYYLYLPACLIKLRGQYETYVLNAHPNYLTWCLVQCLLDLKRGRWHLLETKSMRWWGWGSVGPMEMMTSTRSK